MRGDAVCFQLQQNEVRFGGICLDIFPCGKLCEGFSSFLGNEGLCFLMEGKIRKDMLTDKIRKAVYAPRVCVRFEAIQKCLIGGNAIAQTDAGGGKELGGAAENHDVVIIICQWNCREFCHIIGEFHVSLIYHDIDVVLLADV